MESNLTSISEIRQKGVWHFLPYSQAVRRAESALEHSLYPVISLRDLVHNVQRGFSVSSSAYQDQGIPFLQLSNLQMGKIDLTNLVYISPETHQHLQSTQLHRDNLLVGLISQPKFPVAVYDSDRPANVNQQIAKLDLDTDTIYPDYLAYYLQTDIAQALLMSQATGTTRPVLSIHGLMELPVPYPPIAQQHNIIQMIQQRQQQAREHLDQATSIQPEVNQMLHHALWTGGA